MPDPACLLIFDWDDTLCPSSFLSHRGYDLTSTPTAEDKVQLDSLADQVCLTLLEAGKYGQVHIVTNAQQGWVEMSSKTFLPAVHHLLQYLPVTSARSAYETHFPGSPFQWKARTFLDQVQNQKQVLSFGDSMDERMALKTVKRHHRDIQVKSVKFTTCPSLEHIQKQLKMVQTCLPCITRHPGDLDLKMSVLQT